MTTTIDTTTTTIDLLRSARREDAYGPATGAALVRLMGAGYPIERIVRAIGDADHTPEEVSREITLAILTAGGAVRWQVGGESWDGPGDGPDEPMTEGEIREWLDDASREGWEVSDSPMWVDNWATPIDVVTGEALDSLDGLSITVQIDPPTPECVDDQGHDWQAPYEVLGGLRENPGVWGNGGGVICREVCAHCGVYQVTDTWAQRRDTGTQGHTTVTYEDADEASLAWVQERRAGVR